MMEGLPAGAYAAALAALPGLGPFELAELIRGYGPAAAWKRVLAGEVGPADEGSADRAGGRPDRQWSTVAKRVNVARAWAGLHERAIGVTFLGDTHYPSTLANDPQPPGVLFWVGDLRTLDSPRVAIVGTRRCTGYGRQVAFEIGHDLALAGVSVVSGLALGIDGAAHAGVLAGISGPSHDRPAGWAGPIGVGASGVDRPYPRQHAGLWADVAAAGVMLSETAPSQPAQAWRFPARNRIIAGLSQLVVVVESHRAGGSMLTVTAALDRGVDVKVVPGPVTSSSSAGTNQLLLEGPGPVRHAGDVLDALGDIRLWPITDRRERPDRSRRTAGLDGPTRTVLTAVDRTPTSTTVIAERTGLPVGPLGATLLRLEELGLVQGNGGWWERCPR